MPKSMSLTTYYEAAVVLFLTSAFLVSLGMFLIGVNVDFTSYFDLFIISSLLFFKTSREMLLCTLLLIAYLFYHFWYVAYNSELVYLRDLMISLKFIVYFIIISLICKREVISIEHFKAGFELVFMFFMIKYAVGRALGDLRPPLYTENNFEICFLSLLYIFYVYLGASNKFKFFLFVVVILLSGSRSGILGLAAIYVYQFKPFSGMSLKQIFKITVLGLIGLIVVAVFLSRMTAGGVEEVDRYIFMLVFFENVQEWGFKEIMIGNAPLTPLLDQSCQRLNFYQVLFSQADKETCYPVILHSFWLRAVMEHGILSFFVIYFLTRKILITKGVKNRDAFFCFSLIAINGLSVSAFSSTLIMFALVIICLLESVKDYEGVFSNGKELN
ncbi:hypothetical protein [Pseudoalteromonas viridis]|uniref:Uncharacterized protein n=1 Tax=Pseudoalteromonas viridis TaxID=339617 RepID=A0ABX7V5E5_9GAMM|nr:hypothetical protein [Pseudoalteromonas viridis]QTL36101.1 hypothetical protein J5X90_03365 [Pseudoalteromonas viridis]